MYRPSHLLLFALAISCHSIHDNPDQDDHDDPLQLPHQTTLDELHRKWDYEVWDTPVFLYLLSLFVSIMGIKSDLTLR